jgi:DNA-binding transcriptional LysR family regulator
MDAIIVKNFLLKRNNISPIVSIMEIYELRYFLGVAKYENIHRASEKMNVSPASLSKAVGRLEAELGVSLFARERRNIKLTDQGRLLQRRASEMILLEESTRQEVAGHPGSLQVVMAGPEVLLSKIGTDYTRRIKSRFPLAKFDLQNANESEAADKVFRGEAHIAFITSDFQTKPGFTSKVLDEVSFQTFVGVSHPLYSRAQSKKTIPVEEVLEHSFASPDNPLLGKVGARQSLDGWRDDQFPRKVDYLTSSLKILEELVVGGKAVAYLPAYFCKGLPVEPLRISGCPYSCTQKIRVCFSKQIGWLNQIL